MLGDVEGRGVGDVGGRRVAIAAWMGDAGGVEKSGKIPSGKKTGIESRSVALEVGVLTTRPTTR